MKKLVYIFPCPQYPNGYICKDLGLIKELNLFGDYDYFRKAKCIISNNEIYIDKLDFMWLKKGVIKHDKIFQNWKTRMKV